MDLAEGWLWRDLVRERGVDTTGALKSGKGVNMPNAGSLSARRIRKQREQEGTRRYQY
jgi:hypothetical protein